MDSREGSPPRIGVLPRAAAHSHRRLLSALERATEVRFEPAEGDFDRLDAVLLFPSADQERNLLPPGLPRHAMAAAEAPSSENLAVSLSRDAELPTPVRGQLLLESHAGRLAETAVAGVADPSREPRAVLASADGVPLWQREPGEIRTRSLMAPAELGKSETLRERLSSRRFLALLPLLWFLRTLYAGAQWQAPALRASFIFDDPNLRAFTYGFLDYRELAAWTAARRSHVTLAMVPLDGRLTSRRVVELFRRETGLSLMVHGNNHTKRELERDWEPRELLAMLEQALTRIESFEQRTGVSVPRVMAPPHEHCAEATADAMRRVGFEALCSSRPYPWLSEPPPRQPLVGWGVSEIVAGGLPVMPRLSLDGDPAELVFRALLGQPLIVYGHHRDVSQGLDALDSSAESIDRLGKVRWCSPGEIARSNYSTRIIPSGLELRPYSRRVEIPIPPGCARVRVSPPDGGLDLREHPPRWRRRGEGGSSWRVAAPGEDISVAPGEDLEIALGAPPVRVFSRPGRLIAASAVARRAATEMRDRLQPIGRRPAPEYR